MATKYVLLGYVTPNTLCAVNGCHRTKTKTHQYCSMHYERLRTTGELGSPQPLNMAGLNLYQRLIRKRQITNRECWEWLGSVNRGGYGMFYFAGKMRTVHRASALYFLGAAPSDRPLTLHHCDNRRCFNPNHLYWGTAKDNVADMVKRKRQSSRCGEKNSAATLTWNDVRCIRKRLEKGEQQAALSREYGTTKANLNRIAHNKIWKT